WNGEAQAFLANRVALIPDPHWQDRARDAVRRYGELREKRHRAIHDAVSVGIFPSGDGLYEARPLGVQYRREKTVTTVMLNHVTPAGIALLAWEFYELQRD